MLLKHNQLSIKLLGDPHLGRQFINGVPLARRGERETSMWRDFERSLMEGNHDVHICMGDLFDKWSVPYDVVYHAALLYRKAAKSLSSCSFVILRGNHDISLDLERRGAFDVFIQTVGHLPNVTVVNEPVVDSYGLGFFPWHPTKPADEILLPCEIAFGHWDTVFGKDNMIPTEKMQELGIKKAYTGHVHKPDSFFRDDVQVVQVGSMQPYAHGEEINEDLYVTRTLATLDPAENFKNRCLRIVLEPGEILDQVIDCLQLTIKKLDAEDEAIEVTLGDFDLEALMTQAFDQEGVSEEIRKAVIDRFNTLRIAA